MFTPGSIVSVTIPKENRDWGYNPCEDGEYAEVVRQGTIDHGRIHNFGKTPGIWENSSWTVINLRKSDGEYSF